MSKSNCNGSIRRKKASVIGRQTTSAQSYSTDEPGHFTNSHRRKEENQDVRTTKISPKAPVRIMGAGRTQNGLGMKSRLFATVVETPCSPARAFFLGFNSDAVVHCVLQSLSAPEILFRRLYAHKTK